MTMTTDQTKLKALLLAAFVLAGCGEKRPILTSDVLSAAAQRCGAIEFSFTEPTEGSVLPSFSYLDPGPFDSGKPTPVSSCLAEALKGHRFQSMRIRVKPGASAAQ